jgi:PTH2 family peptidyl-tRNA hydrolase
MKKDVKQVIVLRKFPNMRIGKYASQAAHASMGVFFKSFVPASRFEGDNLVVNHWEIPALEYFEEYITGSFKKIVVYVETEEELLDIHRKVKDANIHCSLIQDAGLTEFKGIPTYTAVGIGPWDSGELNEITGHLPLF